MSGMLINLIIQIVSGAIGGNVAGAQTAIQDARISVSSPLLDGYDEPEILRSLSR